MITVARTKLKQHFLYPQLPIFLGRIYTNFFT